MALEEQGEGCVGQREQQLQRHEEGNGEEPACGWGQGEVSLLEAGAVGRDRLR